MASGPGVVEHYVGLARVRVRLCIEVLFVNVTVFILLIFATLPECSQNQTAVSDTLRLLSDF
jgi:hypothetical protein